MRNSIRICKQFSSNLIYTVQTSSNVGHKTKYFVQGIIRSYVMVGALIRCDLSNIMKSDENVSNTFSNDQIKSPFYSHISPDNFEIRSANRLL